MTTAPAERPPDPEPAPCDHVTTHLHIERICVAVLKPKGRHSHYYVRRYAKTEEQP